MKTLPHSLLALGLAMTLGISTSAMAQNQRTTAGNAMGASPMSDMSTAKPNPAVGGAAMSPQQTIVQNAMRSSDHTTLVSAVKAAGLADTLSGPGPFTVFAPTNEAFAMLPAGTVDTLLKPENKAQLAQILTYHVVPGRLDSQALQAKVQQGGGKATLTTVEGDTLTVQGGQGRTWTVTDSKGTTATITIADVYQSNGVIFVVDKVLMPNGTAQPMTAVR